MDYNNEEKPRGDMETSEVFDFNKKDDEPALFWKKPSDEPYRDPTCEGRPVSSNPPQLPQVIYMRGVTYEMIPVN